MRLKTDRGLMYLDTFFSDHSEDGIYFRSHTYAKFDEESEFGDQNTKIW